MRGRASSEFTQFACSHGSCESTHQLIVRRLFSLRIFEQQVSTRLDFYKHQALAIIECSANGLNHLFFLIKV